jgi:hypothetical protein
MADVDADFDPDVLSPAEQIAYWKNQSAAKETALEKSNAELGT